MSGAGLPVGVLRIATRGSALALVQAEIVAASLRDRHAGMAIVLVTVSTTGDREQQAPVSQLGDGAFVRGVETALLDGRADLAVHSAKDLPTAEVPGLTLVAFPARADPRDVLVSRDGRGFAALSPGARIGTGSPRRAALARSFRPDLAVAGIRGNVDTRLRRLDAGEYDALVLAAAGLTRLDLLDRVTEYLDPLTWLPPAGQGALAVQCRAGDPVGRLAAALDEHGTRAAVSAERAVLRRLGSGCRTPCGAYGHMADGRLVVRGVLLSPDGARTVRAERAGAPSEAEALGDALAADLTRDGRDLLTYADDEAL